LEADAGSVLDVPGAFATLLFRVAFVLSATGVALLVGVATVLFGLARILACFLAHFACLLAPFGAIGNSRPTL